MDSEATTPTRGSCTNGSSQSNSPSPGPKKLRKIVFDDFEVHGEVVYSRDGVIVQVSFGRAS